MGTRGFIGFVVNGETKVAYNHFDSYPSGVGSDVLRWLRKADHGQAREAASNLRVVDPRSQPTDVDIDALAAYLDAGVGEQRNRPDWYQLLRNTQGDPALMLEAGVIEDASGFPAESLFAEWGYVVDFDGAVLEVYKGFQQTAHNAGRFASMTGRDGYVPCRLVKSWPLDQLPSDEDFVAALES